MTNTMEDLRREVQYRLHDTLHGREIDMMEGIKPRLPHMLGITSLNAIHTDYAEDGTLLDPSNRFWQEYHEPVETRTTCRKKIETAIRSLKEDDLFRMTYPYGEEADIIYCEVEPPEGSASAIERLETTCAECGTTLNTEPDLREEAGHYSLYLSLDCEACSFNQVRKAPLHRV